MAPVSMSKLGDKPENCNTSDLMDNENDETDDLLEKDGACWDGGSLERETDVLLEKDGACMDCGNIERETVYRDIITELDGGENKENSEINEAEDDKTVTVDENPAPDGGWGWFIVLGALLLRTVIGGLGRSHGLFYIQFKEKFNGTATTTALVTSLTGFVRLSAGPFVSILCGRFRCRTLTSIGTIVLFIGLILSGFGPNLHFLYFSYGVVAGLGRALTLTPVPIQLGYYFNKRRSLAFGLASAGFSIGGFAITPIVELLFQHFGYQGTFLILSGFALNILVSSALFRPIELHRKLTARDRNAKNDSERDSMVLKSLEQIESGTVLCSSIVSINNDKAIETGNRTTSANDSGSCQKLLKESCVENNHKQLNGISDIVTDENHCNNGDTNSEVNKLLLSNKSERKGSNDNDSTKDNKKKTKLISWSVLKDTRFLCFVCATFCFTLPSNILFLPSLAKTKGVSDIQAATLLSVSAGCDTVFRVISGFVLDFKIFRSHRPLIYNFVTFLQAAIAGLFPLMTNYSEFIMLCIFEGAVAGLKNAQGAVIMIDMLGVDKLASSLAVTMAVQCIAVFFGPTISGQLIDRYGSYNEAFYFGAGAILVGALVMAVGNIVNHCRNAKAKTNSENSESNSR